MISMLNDDTTDLIERLADVQQDKWLLEEKVCIEVPLVHILIEYRTCITTHVWGQAAEFFSKWRLPWMNVQHILGQLSNAYVAFLIWKRSYQCQNFTYSLLWPIKNKQFRTYLSLKFGKNFKERYVWITTCLSSRWAKTDEKSFWSFLRVFFFFYSQMTENNLRGSKLNGSQHVHILFLAEFILLCSFLCR